MADPHNVRAIHGADLPAKQVLEKAAEKEMSGVVVVGWLDEPDENGNCFWVSSSYGNIESATYALQQALFELLARSRT